jgi:hypothetical protein
LREAQNAIFKPRRGLKHLLDNPQGFEYPLMVWRRFRRFVAQNAIFKPCSGLKPGALGFRDSVNVRQQGDSHENGIPLVWAKG